MVAVGHPFDTAKIRLQTQPSVNPIYSATAVPHAQLCTTNSQACFRKDARVMTSLQRRIATLHRRRFLRLRDKDGEMGGRGRSVQGRSPYRTMAVASRTLPRSLTTEMALAHLARDGSLFMSHLIVDVSSGVQANARSQKHHVFLSWFKETRVTCAGCHFAAGGASGVPHVSVLSLWRCQAILCKSARWLQARSHHSRLLQGVFHQKGPSSP